MKIPQSRGSVEIITVTVPTTGADFSQTIPNGEIWKFISASGKLTTDANVGNRTPRLTFTDESDNIYAFAGPNFNLTANSNFTYCWANNLTTGVQTSVQAQVNTPKDIYLAEGWKLKTATGSIQEGDQWSAIYVCVERWRVAG